MRTIEVFEAGETVLIKATVSQVHFEKDRVTYSLKDAISGTPYPNRFSEKDIIPFVEDKTAEEGEGE